jgi:hypothetical protein
MTVSSSGRIGIGNTAPAYTLDVSGNVHATTTVFVDASNAAYIRGGDDHEFWDINITNTAGLYGVQNSAVGGLKLGSGGPTLFGSGSNLGIGTITPASRLDVQGIIFAGSNTATEGTLILQDQYTAGHLTNFGTNRSSGGPVIGYGVYPSAGATNAFSSSTSITASRSAFSMDSEFRWYTGGSQVVSIGSAATLSQRMTLDNNGNLGVGATSPGSRFEIKSSAANNLGGLLLRATSTSNFPALLYENSTNGGALDLYNNATLNSRISANSDSYISASGGNFGIGTTSPAAKLEVVGNARITQNAAAFQLYGTNHTYMEFYPTASAGRQAYFGFPSVGSRQITLANEATSGGDIILLPGSGGSVGISTTSPGHRLDVAGVIRSYTDATYNGENGALIASNATNLNKRVFIGYDGTADIGFIQSVHSGTAYKSLTINAAGGLVGVGTIAPQKIFEAISSVNDFVSVGVNTLSVGQWTGIHFGYRENNNFYRKSAIVFERTDLTEANAQGKIHILNGPQAGSGNATLSNARITIGESGNVGIGTTIPNARLTINNGLANGSGVSLDVTGSGDVKLTDGGSIFFGEYSYAASTYIRGFDNGNVLEVVSNGASSATFKSTGVGIGTTPSYRLDVSGSARITGSLAVGNIAPSATAGRIDAENDVVAFSTSDMRFKTNITPISNALEKITQIGGYEFDWIPNQELHGFEGHDVGVIAQEIEKVLPEVVKERDNGYKAVKYEKIVPLLIEAIKEQQKQIDELKYLLQSK